MISTTSSEAMVIQSLLEMNGITKEKIEEHLNKFMRDALRLKILFVDLEQLKEIVPFERDFLEKNILNDPRVRQHQRQRGPHSKRVWLYEPTIQVIEQIIVNEWN
ncbi:hypothetical protein [Lysinibacillus fusiformis]|uniref:Uncharacterized protein n=1 Tax=Lysinibacillus fusiformis TaxID=28031 RepID=A0A1E4R4P5_9BACI|nr:hypothetical protein [Lysinibacillus fusiformis]ODV55430.1 hypothetical protein BG258_05700 [Lysinibacillus fusiformis]